MSVKDVYMSCTRRFIEDLGDLRILSAAAYVFEKKINDLPSWGADWTQKYAGLGTIHSAGRSNSFKACGRHRHRPTNPPDDPAHLTVRGKVINHIEWMSSHAFEKYYFMDPTRSFLSLDKNLHHVPSDLPKSSDHGEVTRERLLKVFLADFASDDEDQKPLDVELLTTRLKAYDDWPKLTKSEKGSRPISTDLYELQQSRVAQYMRVARCTNGKLTLVTRVCQPGDLVCILHGSRAPVVLRMCNNTDRQYFFISQCYYEDVMYGERVDWAEDEADTFVLV